jgi:hypothetical protein
LCRFASEGWVEACAAGSEAGRSAGGRRTGRFGRMGRSRRVAVRGRGVVPARIAVPGVRFRQVRLYNDPLVRPKRSIGLFPSWVGGGERPKRRKRAVVWDVPHVFYGSVTFSGCPSPPLSVWGNRYQLGERAEGDRQLLADPASLEP